jgi:hypothetical protein
MNKDSRTRRAWWRLLAGFLFVLPVHTPAAAEDAPSISTMLKEGWQIAGYSQELRQSFHFHPLSPPGPSLSGSVPGRLRRDPQATHLLDLLQARVSPYAAQAMQIVERLQPAKYWQDLARLGNDA